MKTVLYMHTGSGNHGCEAIIRSTASLIKENNELFLWSILKSEEIQYGTDKLFKQVVATDELGKYTWAHLKAFILSKRQKDTRIYHSIFINDLFRDAIAVSVGGDNYCYPWSASQNVVWNKEIRKISKASVLWGASVEEKALTSEIVEDLAGYDLITARESLTYDLLKKINPNTIKVSDPAFLLTPCYLPFPKGFTPDNTVGINISPLIMKYGNSDVIMANYEKLIEYILKETNMSVIFIPHVVWKNNNDIETINHLLMNYHYTDRVYSLGDFNAMELKGFIGRCRFFIGARTHATIAAYSSCVPTLAIGYSVKSLGIAVDLFGTDDNYVIDVRNMKEPDKMTNSFIWLMQNESKIRQILADQIPNYKKEALLGGSRLDILKKRVSRG